MPNEVLWSKADFVCRTSKRVFCDCPSRANDIQRNTRGFKSGNQSAGLLDLSRWIMTTSYSNLIALARLMANPISPQARLEKTYNAAADHYDHPALSFWDRFGRRTVERLSLVPGMNVLDVCCGMGGSALPAAERVGPTGKVLAIDLAQNLLHKGSKRAEAAGLTNIEFRRGDLEVLPFPDQSFDAVISVFGIFFVPDLTGTVRGLWRLLRPHGLLAITIWGAKTFEPAD